MADFPSLPNALHGGDVSTASSLRNLNNRNPISTAWPSANLGIFVPVRVGRQITVYKMTMGAGTTAAGNFDIGIYNTSGNLLVSSGATAKGASTEQQVDVADTVIGPGLYYLALSADGTNNYVMLTPSGAGVIPNQKLRLYGILQAATSYPLPASVTFAAVTVKSVPMIVANLRSF